MKGEMSHIRRICASISTNRGEEWLFFGLLLFPFLGMVGATYGLFRLISRAARDSHPGFILAIKGGAATFGLIATITLLLLGINLLIKIELPFHEKIRKITLSIFFPLVILMGKTLSIPEEQIQESPYGYFPGAQRLAVLAERVFFRRGGLWG